MPPTNLRVDHHGAAPLGLTNRSPLLSWWLPEGSATQHAYRVRCAQWDSGEVSSTRSTYTTYAGPPLRSDERVEWQVKVWTDLGESEWSEPAWWEMGLLDQSEWSAQFISPSEAALSPAGTRPAYLLRRRFSLADPPDHARLRATAHGIYEVFINSQRVGDLELTPGWTAYRTNLDVQTYDVGFLLREGDNTICAVLSDGWYRGKTNYTRNSECYGTQLAFLAQLEVRVAGNGTVAIATDSSWESGTGAITRADLIDGETVDLRIEPQTWSAVGLADVELDHLTTSPAPPVRRIERVRPRSVMRIADGAQIVDLGQNINGWVHLRNLGPEGAVTRLTHGELLAPNGDVNMDHLNPVDWASQAKLGAGQVDEVIAAGVADESFEPRHTTHGFQYIRVDGRTDDLSVADIDGVVVHTDMRRTGWFTCSDERLNRLHEAAVWSFRDNACDIPTDCPQRERVGWTGDWQIFAPTAAFLYDVAGFSAKWLRDLAADQWPDGRVSNFIPDGTGPTGHTNEIQRLLTGSSGWGDAAVLVPRDMWLAYGDERVLHDQIDSMIAWVEFAANAARSGRHRTRAEARPDPAPYEDFLWDTGFHWGEWCEPGGNQEDVFTMKKDMADVATAYLYRSSSSLAEICTVLGRHADAERYGALAESVRAAWQHEFIDADGRISPDTQPNLVRALQFGLVPDALTTAAANRLVELIREADTHLTTGFLATPYLLPVLADTGHLNVAYELLLQDTAPSWLAMIDAGATTIWENWEALDGTGQGSLNHYSKGAVVSFLHRYVTGIQIDESAVGYRHFDVRPMPGGGITWAEAIHDSPYGRVRVAWRVVDDRTEIDITVPPGTTATLHLPDGTTTSLVPGTTTKSWATPALATAGEH